MIYDTAEAALAQIESKDYALPFTADSRKLYKIGVAFDTGSRKLVGWKAVEDDESRSIRPQNDH